MSRSHELVTPSPPLHLAYLIVLLLIDLDMVPDLHVYAIPTSRISLGIWPGPRDLGVGIVATSIILLSLSWIVVTARLIIRRKIKGYGVDDGLMVAGLVCYRIRA